MNIPKRSLPLIECGQLELTCPLRGYCRGPGLGSTPAWKSSIITIPGASIIAAEHTFSTAADAANTKVDQHLHHNHVLAPSAKSGNYLQRANIGVQNSEMW